MNVQGGSDMMKGWAMQESVDTDVSIHACTKDKGATFCRPYQVKPGKVACRSCKAPYPTYISL